MKTINTICLALALALTPIIASADGGHGHHGGYGHHGYRSGISVWWGVPAPMYYYSPYTYTYSNPYYNSSTVVVQQPAQSALQPVQPQQQYWYYCESTGTYYPYANSCMEGWKTVPATPGAPAR